jgi:hypothetical protein
MNMTSDNKISDVMLSCIYSFGNASMNNFIVIAKEQDTKFDTEDAKDFAFKWGFDKTLRWHWKGEGDYLGCIEPHIKNAEEKIVLGMWLDEKIDSDDDWEVFDSIEWRFTPTGQDMYMRGNVKKPIYRPSI